MTLGEDAYERGTLLYQKHFYYTNFCFPEPRVDPHLWRDDFRTTFGEKQVQALHPGKREKIDFVNRNTTWGKG